MSGARWWMDEEELKKRLYSPEHGGSVSSLARATGVHRSTLDTAVHRTGLPRRGNRWAPLLLLNDEGKIVEQEQHEPLPIPESVDRVVREVDPPEWARMRAAVQRAQSDAAQARKEAKELAKRANVVEDVRSILLPVVEELRLLKVPAPRRSKPTRRRHPVTAVGSWTDWHFGDEVDPAEVVGENAYSPGIAVSRVEHVVDTTIALLEDEAGVHPVERLIIVENGDAISNMHALHGESATEISRAGKQAIDVALLKAQALRELAQHVPEILVVAPAGGGNHDRTTRRPSTGKAQIESSWAAMIYELTAALVASQSNIRWHVPTAYRALFEVYGSTICAMHGHAMKGGGGNLGIPAYALKRVHDSNVRRSAAKARRSAHHVTTLEDALSQLRGIVRHVMIGHFHTAVRWQIGDGFAMIDPSLKGPDTFSVDQLERESPAAQALRFFHPEHDLIGEHLIRCDHLATEPESVRYVTGALEGNGLAVEMLATAGGAS